MRRSLGILGRRPIRSMADVTADTAMSTLQRERIGQLEAELARLRETPPAAEPKPEPAPGSPGMAPFMWRVLRPVLRPFLWRLRTFLIGPVHDEMAAAAGGAGGDPD